MNDFYNFPVGETKMRIMSDPVEVVQKFGGGKYQFAAKGTEGASSKGWVWASIRPSNELKIVKLPYIVIKQLNVFRTNEEYFYESYPMPYDVTLTATGEGKKRRYTLSASRKNTDLTEEEAGELTKKTPIADIVQRMKNKQDNAQFGDIKTIKYPEEDLDFDNVPF
jgi:hypothetical protein